MPVDADDSAKDGADGGDGSPSRERRIRSFVLRQGRTTPAQERAFDLHWQRFGIDYTATTRNFTDVFRRAAPCVLEIGFGNGGQLVHAALAEPERDFIGIEVHRPGVGRVMNALSDADIDNVRVYRHDAVEVIAHEIGPATLAEVRIWFPDPWHKKRHHKRRLVQHAFLDVLASRVSAGGRLHIATDWADYAEHIAAELDASAAWRVDPAFPSTSQRPPWRSETHFERRGLKLGHRVFDFVFQRVDESHDVP